MRGPYHGAMCWLSVPSLLVDLGVKYARGLPRWLQERCKKWETQLGRQFGLEHWHLRRSAPTQRKAELVELKLGAVVPTPTLEEVMAHRVWPEQTMSIFALLALLFRWGYGGTRQEGGLVAEACRARARFFIDGLFDHYSADLTFSFKISFGLAKDAMWRPPMVQAGTQAVEFVVVEGHILIRRLLRSAQHVLGYEHEFTHSLQAKCEITETWLLGSFLQWVWHEDQHENMFKQLIWEVGTFIDGIMAEATWGRDESGYGDALIATTSTTTAAVAPRRGKVGWRERDRELYQYWLMGQSKFASELISSFAIDFSRVSHKNRAFGAFALPNNFAFIAPPTDHEQTQIEVFLLAIENKFVYLLSF